MYAVVHFPNPLLQAALRGFSELWTQPVALVDPTETPPRLCAVNEVARARGVVPGLTPTQAQARCGHVQLRPRLPDRENHTRDAITQCLAGFSPHLEATAPGCFTLDLRSLSELRNAPPEGLKRWAKRLRTALAALELKAHLGIGPTPNLARHAAGAQTQVQAQSEGHGTGEPEGHDPAHPPASSADPIAADCQIVTDPAAFVAALPVRALEPSPAVAVILDQWGVRTVGELLALGQSAVTDRIGLEALALFAAADTRGTRLLRLVKPAESFTESYDFEEPVETLEPVLFLFRRFVDQLSRRLEPSGLVAGELQWQLRLESGQTLDRTITVPDPTRHPDVLFRILQTQLETVRTDAAVVGVTLSLQPGRPLTRQFTLFQTVLRDPGQLQETLGRLSALLGADRVGSPVRVPGAARDSFRLEPPDFEQPAHPEPPRPALVQPVPWRRLRPAPAAQVDSNPTSPRAVPATATATATVLAPAATPPPKAVRSPVATGRLKRTLGPWRASGRWWEPGAWAREDWEVETIDGTVVRLSRTQAGWHVTDLLD